MALEASLSLLEEVGMEQIAALIAEHSIYAFIEQTLQLQIAYAQRTIEAVPRLSVSGQPP